MSKKQLWIVIAGVVVVVLIAISIFMVAENPGRKLSGGLEALRSQKPEKFMSLVDPDLSKKKSFELSAAVEDFTSGESLTTKVISDESWRVQDEKIIPTPRYIASNYKAVVELSINQQPINVVIRLKRLGATDQLHYFSFIFKPWTIESLKVQK